MVHIESHERTTGMGARSFTAVLVDGRWMPVSQVPGRRYHGRDAGWERYSIDVADGTPHASFYRSNSGREEVTIHADGRSQTVQSFDDADWWAEIAVSAPAS